MMNVDPRALQNVFDLYRDGCIFEVDRKIVYGRDDKITFTVTYWDGTSFEGYHFAREPHNLDDATVTKINFSDELIRLGRMTEEVSRQRQEALRLLSGPWSVPRRMPDPEPENLAPAAPVRRLRKML